MGYEYNKSTGRIDKTKPAVKSVSIWIGVGTVVLGVAQALPEIVEQVGPLLPPQVLGIATAAAGVIAILRKIYGDNTPVKGVISDDK